MRRVSNRKLCPILNAKIIAQSIEDLPVIIQFSKDDNSLITDVSGLFSGIKRNLSIINGLAGNLSTDVIYRLASSPEVDYISFDSGVYTLLDIAAPTIGAYYAHDRRYEGENIGVAVIDTGVAPHNDLVKPFNRIIGFKDFINGKEAAYDDNGHGTHVAGIIGGNGYSSRGKYLGVAPKANIIAIKALDENGGGSVSKIIEAISYVVNNKERYNTKIINLSIGTPPSSSCDKDPMCRAVEKAIQSGLVVVAAAGNSGPGERTILSPGASRNAITVGAVDDKRTIDPSDDTIAPFSSIGPTNEGYQKPDVVAPGVNINSLSNSKLDGYFALSGTSMATPLVSGAVALLLNKHPHLKPHEVKEELIDCCVPINESLQKQGAGMLNLKPLFGAEDIKANNTIQPAASAGGDFMESVIMILVILFLLDSRI